MQLKDELKLRIHLKIRERFPLEEQKKLAKNYYSLFRDELINMAIDTFVDYSNGVDMKTGLKKRSPGPKPVYKDDDFLSKLKMLIIKGKTIEEMKEALKVSQPTISKAKKFLRTMDTKDG